MRILVQKFGGSSLATPELRQQVLQHILQAHDKGKKVVVVVSAMGRKGDSFATDTLLDFFSQVVANPPVRERDLVLSCGEVIAAAVMAAEIIQAGHAAVAFTGWQAGVITEEVFGQAEIIRIKKERILKQLQEGKIVVVAGFQGVTENGEITTLGRGGSDTSAVAIAAALEAEQVEIYSDVAAVMTADPRLVPEAKPIRNIGYQEVLQMAREGAKVIHPRAVDIALQYNLPLVLKKTGMPDQGTLVTHQKLIDGKSLMAKTKIVTGITHVTDLVQVTVPQADNNQVEEILKQLSAAGISIDLISFSPQDKMFTVDGSECSQVKQILQALGFAAQIKKGVAKVTVVGFGMRGVPGVMSRIVTALNRVQVPILQTADSHLNISCLIPEKDVASAVRSLHQEFGLEEE
ncbi:MAG: aspartate kinase [Firmicutes bacterium]|nr:aspartate kinase [Bacillota bacterium]